MGFSAPERIDLKTLLDWCEEFDLTHEDLELILKIEDVRYPLMIQKTG